MRTRESLLLAIWIIAFMIIFKDQTVRNFLIIWITVYYFGNWILGELRGKK